MPKTPDDQADLFAGGAERRDSGMAIAADAQEADEPGWSARAYQAIVRIAQERSEIHTDDLAANFAEPPRHFNAWGSIWMQAIRAGIIERTGRYRHSTDPKKHAHVYPVYRSRLFNGAATLI
jgi:hypothetical protein